MKIIAGQDWDVSHEVPLALGGKDEPANMRPAYRRCHRVITREQDLPRIAKAKRSRASHIGARQSARKIPGSRGTGWRKPIYGPAYRVDE
jgi:hypothetical protein